MNNFVGNLGTLFALVIGFFVVRAVFRFFLEVNRDAREAERRQDAYYSSPEYLRQKAAEEAQLAVWNRPRWWHPWAGFAVVLAIIYLVGGA